MEPRGNKQIYAVEVDGTYIYTLGSLTITCENTGSIKIERLRVDRKSEVTLLGDDEGDDLLTCLVAHNQLLLEAGGGIRHNMHDITGVEPSRRNERRDN